MESPERITLKGNLRSELIKIGCQAVVHALRFNPSEEIRRTIDEYLALFQTGEAGSEIFTLGKYCLDNSFLYALQGLQLMLTEPMRTPRMYDLLTLHVFLPCSDAGIFGPWRTAHSELHKEDDWQTANLRPLIDKAYQVWRTADKELKKQEKKLKVGILAVE